MSQEVIEIKSWLLDYPSYKDPILPLPASTQPARKELLLTHYPYASKPRFHGFFNRHGLFEVREKNVSLQGDALKGKILSDFIKTYCQNKNAKEIRKEYETFKQTKNYQILKTGQTIISRLLIFLGLYKTTSVEALHHIVLILCQHVDKTTNLNITQSNTQKSVDLTF